MTAFNTAQFHQPSAQFRGAPFWSLNHDLTDHHRLREQIDAFAEMGLGGYHLHVRAGLKTEYMGPAFMDAITAAREHGHSKGMLSYLYDEDTWPSGFAGGAVTTERAFRQRWLSIKCGKPTLTDHDQALAAYRIVLDTKGYLKQYQRLDWEAATDSDWYAYRQIAPDNDRFNGAAYLDTLNPKAVAAFINSTHEKYLAHFGGTFPEDVPAIFTDEPQIAKSELLSNPHAGQAKLPWTDDFDHTFQEQFSVAALDILPEIIWPYAEAASVQRWRFYDHVSERFANAFADQIGQWCEQHGIAMTGHMMAEESLGGQINCLGEAMRHYRGFQIPGIDILCDKYEPSTAKQAVSVARQDGRQQVLSELYGVTNWDFPFRGHKCQGDWQAALGINVRVHHLAWLSMEGQSKRDYPAAIGPQSPWFKEYKSVEDHFARVNVALQSGVAHVKIGVIHPVESAWLHRGVNSLDHIDFASKEQQFHQLINWLLEGQLDFDFIAESLLPQQHHAAHDQALHVGAMAYDCILLPNLECIRSSTLNILEEFMQRGGQVIILGDVPARCDGAISDQAQQVLASAQRMPLEEARILAAMEGQRFLDVQFQHGGRVPHINHQIRKDADDYIVFCSHRKLEIKSATVWANNSQESDIRLNGHFIVTELDTNSGEEKPCAFLQTEKQTVVPWHVYSHSHRLLRLKPGRGEHSSTAKAWLSYSDCPEPQSVERAEENVLLLDMPEWRLNNGPWQPAQDSLTTQLQLAEQFHWPDWAQPYSVKDKGPTQLVSRRFEIRNDIPLNQARLMCERLDDATIRINGATLDTSKRSWWIDRDLSCCDLPDIPSGTWTLEIDLPLNAVDRHLEWCYILGDFDVRCQGAHAHIIAPQHETYWGDLSKQGQQFYGGNVDYLLDIQIENDGVYAIRCPNFGGPLIRVFCDGRDYGQLAYDPFRVELGQLSAGSHRLRLRCFGNRHNTFGALHNQATGWSWWGPPAWRTTDCYQNDIWQLKASGITHRPIIEKLDSAP